MERAIWSNSRGISERIFIEGKLVLQTPTAFGGEQESSLVDLPLARDPLEGRGILAGSSLAGALRNYLRERECGFDGQRNSGAMESRLFGYQERDEGEQSYLIVYDALSDAPHTEVRDGVKLRVDTRTAERGKKFDIELMEAGTTFPIRIELLLPKDQQLQATLIKATAIALEGLEIGEIRLGIRKRRGYGECQVTEWKINRYNLNTPQGLTEWIESSKKGEVRGNQIAILLKCNGAEQVVDNREFFAVEGTFAIEGSILIRGGASNPNAPDSIHLHSKYSEKYSPILSGTSVAGALRGRALRICKTLNPGKKAKEFQEAIFGPEIQSAENTAKASKLVVNETVIENPLDLVQTRVKIDRFTGGTYPSALFNEQPVFGQNRTRVSLKLILQHPSEGEIGLILLLLKDLWTADLPLGGEISIGRGRLRGEYATLQYKRKDETTSWLIKDDGGNLNIEGDKARLESFVKQFTEEIQK